MPNSTDLDKAMAARFLALAVESIKLANRLNCNFAGRHIAHQLVRSATSAGANYQESRGAESRSDFIHKMQIALKELKESHYWLELIIGAGLISAHKDHIDNLIKETEELVRIVAKSIVTAKAPKREDV
jgi:four helix bundle protein